MTWKKAISFKIPQDSYYHEMSAFLTKTIQCVDIWKMLKLYSKLQISIPNENHLINDVQGQKKFLEQELLVSSYVRFLCITY